VNYKLTTMKKSILLLLLPALLFAACKKDDKPAPSISSETVELNFDKEHQFSIKEGSNDYSASGLTWTSSDLSVGTITASGLFKAKKIGKTTIKAEGNGISLTSEVTVKPYSTLCKEPAYTFGISINAVKALETRSLLSQTVTGLNYAGENAKVRNILYAFENGLLVSSALLIADNQASVEEAVKFLAERYTYQGESEEVFYFSNGSVIIGLSFHETLGYNAIYIKNTVGAVSSLQEVKRAYKNRMESLNLNDLQIKP
jgi:hypothetical protein